MTRLCVGYVTWNTVPFCTGDLISNLRQSGTLIRIRVNKNDFYFDFGHKAG